MSKLTRSTLLYFLIGFVACLTFIRMDFAFGQQQLCSEIFSSREVVLASSQRKASLDVDQQLKINVSKEMWNRLHNTASSILNRFSTPIFTQKNLTEAELISIMYYVLEGHTFINARLRKQKLSEEDYWGFKHEPAATDWYIHVLRNAISKLDDVKGTVRRGATLSESQLLQYQPGKVVVEEAFTSTSPLDKVIMVGNVEYYIESSHGKSIAFISTFSQEVLFKPGTQFLVTSKEQINDGTWIIRMEEVP